MYSSIVCEERRTIKTSTNISFLAYFCYNINILEGILRLFSSKGEGTPYIFILHGCECRKKLPSASASETYCMPEEDHFDWHTATRLIHHGSLSYTATSDFEPSHPPTSSPKPPALLSHKSSSSHWVQSKAILHAATNTPRRWERREGEKEGGKGRRWQRDCVSVSIYLAVTVGGKSLM